MDVVGTNRDDRLEGTSAADFMSGELGDDHVVGGDGADFILGGGGSDVLHGAGGADVMFGASSLSGSIDPNRVRIGVDYEATVTFVDEDALFRNTIGVYKIAEDGTIYDVEILFDNASLRGSGGKLKAGQSNADLDLTAGESLGFFVVPDAYNERDNRTLFRDKDATYKFVDADGNLANANSVGPVQLVHVGRHGDETTISSEYGTDVYHSIAGLNGDGAEHVKAEVDSMSGTLTIGFEDLIDGGDGDFNDNVIQIDIGQINAALLPRPGGSTTAAADNDVIDGGAGDDVVFGMRGDDSIAGGAGDDDIWGNSGSDSLSGGDGADHLLGGSGDDFIWGGAGDDWLGGNTGDDTMFGGDGDDHMEGTAGNDTLWDGDGDDNVLGGSGDDLFMAGAGSDTHDGGSGFDTIDYSGAEQGLKVDLSKHWVEVGAETDAVNSIEGFIGSDFADVIKADKRDNTVDGGGGDDVIRGYTGADTMSGGDGHDTYRWERKDLDAVDTILDFLSEDDALDFSGLVKATKYDDVSEVVSIEQTEAGSKVSVYSGATLGWQDVVMLAGVDVDVATLVDDGSLII